MYILDYPDRLTDKTPDPELMEKLTEMTKEIIKKYKPVIILNDKEYQL